MMNDYERVRNLIREETANQNINSVLLKLVDDLVARIDADPDLRQGLIRETVRSMIFSSYWLPRS